MELNTYILNTCYSSQTLPMSCKNKPLFRTKLGTFTENLSKTRPTLKKLVYLKETPKRFLSKAQSRDFRNKIEPSSLKSSSHERKRKLSSPGSITRICEKTMCLRPRLLIKPEKSLTLKRKSSKESLKKSITGATNKMNEEFIRALQRSNGYFCAVDSFVRYRYYVAPGNNSELIVDIMKKRPKWKRIYTFTRAHFIWTPWLSLSVLDTLPKYDRKLAGKTAQKIQTISESVIPDYLSYEQFPVDVINARSLKLYNKLPGNHELTCKKSLFYNMQEYYNKKNIDPFTKIPLTYHIKSGSYDSVFRIFFNKFLDLQKKGLNNFWIVKPAENTNRGFGIKVCKSMEEIIECVNNKNEYHRTFIIQRYIDNPLLYIGRKFDIRCYSLINSFQNNIQGYFYKEGYVRTCTEKFSLKNVKNQLIHLTNDAIQKQANGYGKYENANKLSYQDLQDYLTKSDPNVNFFKHILPQIKDIVRDTIEATFSKLNTGNKTQCFEIMGYDFMIDTQYKVWLIEVNTNPCLELAGPYLECLIPKMLENAFGLTIDQFFYGNSGLQNDFELVFSELKYEVAEYL